MRICLLLAACGLLAVPAALPANADDSAVAVALAPGEVLVEIDAVGTATAPAQRARLFVSLSGRGSTAQEARRNVEAEVARVTAAAHGAGVAAEDIRPVRGVTRMGFIGNAIPEEYEMPTPGQALESERRATRILDLLVRNPSTAERVRDAIEEHGAVSGPEYEAADPDRARRAARADALRRAVADAESLASAANMRVARVLRISERMEAAALSTTMMRRMMGEAPPRAPAMQVEAQVHLSVDFAFAPR